MAERHNSNDAMEKLLARGLRQELDTSGKDCPDVGTLAAYFDRALRADEVQRWEPHFSTCARCQQQLAALARSEPGVATPADQPFRFWRWQWLAPLATAAAAVALWIAVRPPAPTDMASVRQPAASPVAGAKRPVSSESEKLAADKLAKELAEKNFGVTAGKPAEGFAVRSKVDGPVSGGASGKGAAATVAHAEADSRLKDQASGRRDAAPPAAAPAVGAVAMTTPQDRQVTELKAQQERPAQQAAAEPQRMAQNQVAVGREESQKVDRLATQTAAPSAPASADESRALPKKERAADVNEQGKRKRGVAETRSASGYGALATSPAPPAFASPDGRTAWRFAGGELQRSTDSGRTWTATLTPAQEVTAGVCLTEKTCWAVGKAGLVLRTADGEKWEVAAAPAPANLTSVTAIDSSKALVTAADGKRFETSDGGKTWRLLR